MSGMAAKRFRPLVVSDNGSRRRSRPLMARLADPQSGLILPLYHQLMLTHWIRVALVTAYGLLAFWMLLRSITATKTLTPCV
jgi:hypothetical protein